MNAHAAPPGGATTDAMARGSTSLLANWISLLGFFLVGASLVMILVFTALMAVAGATNPYLDILGYLVLPSFFVVGLVIVPVGIAWKYWRARRGASRAHLTLALPRVDLNDRRLRRRIGYFVLFNLVVILPVLAVSSYEGYLYTESTAFCGQTCHTVMEPQATAHANSPHARVACAECHIGSGASWFVKSKLSGVRQVFAVAFDTYRRPIPPAITELRPARDTCEECHWPNKFFGERYKELVHYSPDEQNTRRVVRMLLKVGGADESIGKVAGIHMHMLVSGRIEYVAVDDGLQQIPWVKYTTPGGSVRVFRSDAEPADAPPPAGVVRVVDCMDCHNRGAHHFRAPQVAVDQFLEVDRIDAHLPYVKREAVRTLLGSYPDAGLAARAIEQRVLEFYRQQYPAVWASERLAVEQGAAAVVELYRRNMFPGMDVDWRTYPENIGHMNSPGCFRCHDGLHKDAAGVAIQSDCHVCHVFLNDVPNAPDTLRRGEFVHSMDLRLHSELRCNECHNGGELRLCRDCHADPTWQEKWGKGQFRATTQPGWDGQP